jgi:hypothetical protein
MNMDALLNSPQFKQALFDVHDQECERFAATMKPVTFSPKFERKMERLLRAQKKPYYPLVNTNFKKAVLAMAVVFILMVTTVFSVSALREPVVRFFVEVYEKFSQVFFHHNEEEQFPATLEVYYAPAWLPDGYQENTSQMVDAIIFCERIYTGASKDDILFRQYTFTSSALRIDTEGVDAESVIINGNAGLSFSNKEIQHLTWNDKQYGFSVSGPVSKADLMRLAGSIQAVEK